jgi:serine/threonine-protein kinase
VLPTDAQFCMRCGTATPTDPGVPPRTQSTGAFEVAQVTKALVGRYKIERVLGEGGMATVYLAEDAKHRRKVAVKVMRPELAATLGADRFLREVQIAAQLSHPHILPMHDSGEADGLLYYVMPYVEGETLKERLAREGALAPEEAIRLAREVADALAYAHKRGIVHRDIKPANILLNEGYALVADFGIARALEDGSTESLTKTGLAVGTPQYMAPEQATGEKTVDGRADVYATGAILYEMLTGEPPFTGQNARAILTKSLTEKPKPITQVRAGLAPAVDTVVQKALAKGADERYSTATEFVTALESVRAASSGAMPALTPSQATEVVTPVAPAARAGWRSPRTLAVGGVALAALVAAVFAFRGAKGSAGDARGASRDPRIVVLPFTNQGATGDEYLAEGVSDEVRGKLSNLSGLVVIASTSTNQYKGSSKTPQEIARELEADYLLGGTVRWSGDGVARRVRVMPELIEATTGAVKWQQSFEAQAADVFELQSNLASQVTSALGVTLVGTESQDLAARPTENVAAYEAYLRAIRRTGSSVAVHQARRSDLEQAVALDSGFAMAWAELARILALLQAAGTSDATLEPRAREAVATLERVAPGSAALHLARSRFLDSFVKDSIGAWREVDAALRLAPNDVNVLLRAASIRSNKGNWKDAMPFLMRAREVDPRSPQTLMSLMRGHVALGQLADASAVGEVLVAVSPQDEALVRQLLDIYLQRGDVAGARASLRAAERRGVPMVTIAADLAGTMERGWLLEDAEQRLVLRLTPTAFNDERSWWAQSLAILHWQRGDTAAARAYADSAIAPTRADIAKAGGPSQQDGLLGIMLAMLGRAPEARAAVARGLQDEAPQSRDYRHLSGARAEMVLGNRDAALDHLEQIPPSAQYARPIFVLDPFFASLKGHPRFEQFLKSR